MNKHSGNPVSTGIGIGHIYRHIPFEPNVSEKHFAPSELQAQLDEYSNAKLCARAELTALFDSMSKLNPEKAHIFKAHGDILDDEVMDEEIVESIKAACIMPDYAVFTVYNTYIGILGGIDDPLLKERTVDLQDVRNRLIRNLYKMEEKNLSSLNEPSIVIAKDLFPSDTATLDRKNVVGIATEQGGTTSHSAIIAKSYGIAAILGVPNLLESVDDGVFAILDATLGEILLNPDEDTIANYRKKQERLSEEMDYTKQFVSAEAITKDGVKIDIGMNIGGTKLPEFSDHAEFVGLFRTEFLYMESSHMPTEQEQYEAYGGILSAMGSRPVTLRTLDIGGDKKLDYLPLPAEENPFLGNRALRLCLDKPELFEIQLRAALRASVHGNLWIMFPMVGSIEDWRRAKAKVDDVKAQLDGEGIPYSKDIKIGVMIEIPSVAIFADKLAAGVDFASIGTNDLCQYLFAVDRMNPQITNYYQEFSPILFRILGQIAEAFNEAGKPLSICGELGGNHWATAILVGLGFNKLSMNTSSFGLVRRVITAIGHQEAVNFAQKVLSVDTEAEVKNAISEFMENI